MTGDADPEDIEGVDDLSEQARAMIAELVDLGLDTPDQIVERVCDIEGVADADWTRDEIVQCVEAKRLIEATWPRELDTDRLDRVFAELAARRIACVPQASFRQDEAWEALGSKGIPGFEGFVFWRREDAERTAGGGGMRLGYGSCVAEADAVKVARRIEHRLQVAGFDVDWDGDPARPLVLRGFDFRRRGVPAAEA